MAKEKKTTTEELNLFRMADSADEEQMLAEIRGEVLEAMVYVVQGKHMLSWAAIKLLSIEQGKFDIVDFDLREIKDENGKTKAWMAMAKAKDIETGATRVGIAYQKQFAFQMGRSAFDEFAPPKAASKAQRNAIRQLIPETVLAAYLGRLLAEQKATKKGKKTVRTLTAKDVKEIADKEEKEPDEEDEDDVDEEVEQAEEDLDEEKGGDEEEKEPAKDEHECKHCGKVCGSLAGLQAHMRAKHPLE